MEERQRKWEALSVVAASNSLLQTVAAAAAAAAATGRDSHFAATQLLPALIKLRSRFYAPPRRHLHVRTRRPASPARAALQVCRRDPTQHRQESSLSVLKKERLLTSSPSDSPPTPPPHSSSKSNRFGQDDDHHRGVLRGHSKSALGLRHSRGEMGRAAQGEERRGTGVCDHRRWKRPRAALRQGVRPETSDPGVVGH